MVAHSPIGVLVRKLRGADGLTQAEQQAVSGLPMTIRTFAARQDIVLNPGRSTCCCIVLEGWTCCYQMLDGGRRPILALHVPGDLPDLQSLYLPDPDFSMIALTRATIAFVPHESIRELMTVFPKLASAFWRDALIGAAIHRAWIAGLSHRDARGRFAHLLCELYLRLRAVNLVDGFTMPIPLRQPDLADVLGLTSVHVNRTLQNMRADGLIGLQSRKLEIRDWSKLCMVAEFNPHYLHLPA